MAFRVFARHSCVKQWTCLRFSTYQRLNSRQKVSTKSSVEHIKEDTDVVKKKPLRKRPREIYRTDLNTPVSGAAIVAALKHSERLSPALPSDTSDKIEDKEPVTVFHKPSNQLLTVNLLRGENNVSIFFKENEQLVSLRLNREAIFKEVLEKELKKDPAHVKVESVEEILWKEVKLDRAKLHDHYLKLAKIRLTGLVVVTTMAGYAMAPGVFHPLTFALCTVGTGLTSAAANSINQYLEVPFDSQMNRTKNRPIVRGNISPLHAVTFAVTTGGTGLTLLLFGVNPLTAGLGVLNLVLYTSVYTPMKRLSIANTWVGSVVGAIPPMMGWAACTGTLDPGAWLLGGILYAWQFPHFNALSWNLRPDYSRAGYRMMSVLQPELCKRVTLRYSLGLICLCTLAPVLDVTSWVFAFDSFPVNAYMVYLAYQFYRKGDSNSSRKLFRYSLVHIPLLMVLMLISKKSFTDRKNYDNVFKVSKLW